MCTLVAQEKFEGGLGSRVQGSGIRVLVRCTFVAHQTLSKEVANATILLRV
jgi:hypothetical protein